MHSVGGNKTQGTVSDKGPSVSPEFKSKNLKLRSEEVRRIMSSIQGADISDNILKKLSDTLRSIRLLVLSEESREIVINHGFQDTEIDSMKQTPMEGERMIVNVFDKSKKYFIVMDRRYDEAEEYRLKKIVYPMVESFIKNEEILCFRYALLDSNRLENIERDIEVPPEKNDYHTFLNSVILKCIPPLSFHESQEDKQYTDNFLKSLEICRIISLSHEGNKNIKLDDVPQEIDHILGGKINRKILHMTKSMLLSRNENMNGSGHPFGLSKKNIPLEGRIYAIIRTYEALSYTKKPMEVVRILEERAQLGYFDSDILRIFLESLREGIASKGLKSPNDIDTVSDFRKNKYSVYIQSWSDLLAITKDIRNICHEGREACSDAEIQSVSFKKANKLRLKLRVIADIRKVLIVTRHGETESDVPGGAPGGENEVLTKQGKQSSIKKGKLLKGLRPDVFTSPLVRACQTTAEICQQVRGCVRDIIPIANDRGSFIMPSCASCPAAIIEKVLMNPIKNREDGRYDSPLGELLANPNIKGLEEFLKKLVSSSQESMNLFVTHRDSARHLIILLENLFSQTGISSKKIIIKNEEIHEFFFRGDGIVLGKNKKTRGLLFSVTNWKSIISKLNLLAENIFGEVFYIPASDERLSLIDLHDQFLDFIDLKQEQVPGKLTQFIELLRVNPTTKHFPDILRTAGVID